MNKSFYDVLDEIDNIYMKQYRSQNQFSLYDYILTTIWEIKIGAHIKDQIKVNLMEISDE